jgi:transcriptional repressor NrdR
MEDLGDKIRDEITDKYEREVPGEAIGKLVMEGLRDIDDVAYVRFASVYRRFEDIEQFLVELDRLRREREVEA